jgi:hypothetical protein
MIEEGGVTTEGRHQKRVSINWVEGGKGVSERKKQRGK